MIPLPIETERLTIRPFAESDLARVTAIFTDPVVMEYIVARVDVRNTRSLRTAARIGMRPVGEVEDPPHMLFEVLRP